MFSASTPFSFRSTSSLLKANSVPPTVNLIVSPIGYGKMGSLTWIRARNMLLSRISDTGQLDMGLHLVGETIDKNRSHYGAETGKLVQLMRGIYVPYGDQTER